MASLAMIHCADPTQSPISREMELYPLCPAGQVEANHGGARTRSPVGDRSGFLRRRRRLDRYQRPSLHDLLLQPLPHSLTLSPSHSLSPRCCETNTPRPTPPCRPAPAVLAFPIAAKRPL